MKKEMFFEGKTMEDAKAKAAAALGVDEDLLTFELVTMPAKGIFGLGAVSAKIKVEVEVEDEPVAEEKKPAPIFEEKIAKKQNPAPQAKPEAPKAEKPAPAPITVPEAKSEASGEEADAIIAFLKGALDEMGLTDAEIKVYDVEPGVLMAQVSGEKMGVLIGHRGETLDAMQYLATLHVNRKLDKKIKLIIDTENYRAKRIASLESLARKTADKATKYKKNITLEPMTPYERRIIHSALGDRPHISTYSVGSEPRRKVVVRYEK